MPDPYVQYLGRTLPFQRKLHLAATGVAVRIAGDLGNGGGDARLVLAVEAEQVGNLAAPLARDDDVLFVLESHCQQ
jgi:hypothetical protein